MSNVSNEPQALVTAVLPEATAGHVLAELAAREGSSGLTWQARGTLLREHWLARWMPPVGPGKTILQTVVPVRAADGVMASLAEGARLNQQATGAVFSVPCSYSHVGSGFHRWTEAELAALSSESPLSGSLSLICCIVGATHSDRVARAAVEAGAHGPIVYLSEGHGLRDRIGWLRITKDHQQEVQLVVVDTAQVDDVFGSMASAGRFHLPGRGLLYAMPLGRGMVNLPSRFSRQRELADMHQIIRTIDHLAGHSEWRRSTLGENSVRSAGSGPRLATVARVALTAVVRSEHVERVSDLILDGGAGGLNRVTGRFVGAEDLNPDMGARVQHEYVVLRSIVDEDVASYVCEVVDQSAEALGVQDMCLLAHPVTHFARYQYGAVDYRDAGRAASA